VGELLHQTVAQPRSGDGTRCLARRVLAFWTVAVIADVLHVMPVCLVVVLAAGSASAQTSMPGLLLEGSAAPQGRAIDFAATLEYRPAPRWTVFGGYRTIEGSADVDTVYTFAWLNPVVSGIGVRF
jgi:hypothetical protein